MKGFVLILLIFSFLLCATSTGFCDTFLYGKVIGTHNKKLFSATGETVVVNLGQRQGLVKGDILKVTKKDGMVKNFVGDCVILEAFQEFSLCEILKTNMEITAGDEVRATSFPFSDEKLRPIVTCVLNSILEPYPPLRKVSIFISGIFDRENRVTQFSSRVIGAFSEALSKRRQFVLVSDALRIQRLRNMIFHPDYYFQVESDSFYRDEIEGLKDLMEKIGLDVTIMGTYSLESQNIKLSIYSIDRNFGPKKFVTRIPLAFYSETVTQVIERYVPPKGARLEQVILSYKVEHFFPSSREQKRISQREAQVDIGFRYMVFERNLRFNRISPENVMVSLNGKPLKIKEEESLSLYLDEGLHTISISFQPAFYIGNELLYVSKRRISKDIVIDVNPSDKLMPIYVDVILSTDKGKEEIRFEIYRKEEKVSRTVKNIPVRRMGEKYVEVYKD
ncbi:MAG: hypothetical protein NZ583_07055 [Desulfobacterota bacterium]|nr:hypothetical protein [Thermodesulfobacteriota bacterium]MDW8002164.1 hypothetical protein [Deltaproteobacteria bacterium]